MQTFTPIESLVKRDRMIVIAGVVAVAAIAWGYTVYLAQSNADVGMSMGMAGGNVRSWSGVDFSLMFVMWVVMMVAMMVPSAAPMILLFATVNRRRESSPDHSFPPACFYRVIWLSGLGSL